MISTSAKQIISCALSCLLVIAAAPYEVTGQQPPSEYSGQGAPLSPDELQQLVAPIALYPDKQYALKFISDPGKQNGLYWQSSPGQPESPLGPLVAFATSEGYSAKPDAHVPFNGYYFHILKGQTDKARGGAKNYVVSGKMIGGFAFVAYPAEYGNSGVMTFMINQDEVLLEKDLGKTTVQTATAMTEFDPDTNWRPVQQ